jgi:hypothetical protein
MPGVEGDNCVGRSRHCELDQSIVIRVCGYGPQGGDRRMSDAARNEVIKESRDFIACIWERVPASKSPHIPIQPLWINGS